MKRILRKGVCWALALAVAAACLPGTVLATEITDVTGEGTLVSPKVTVTQSSTTEEETGEITTTTTTVREAAGTTPEGAEVEKSEIKEETVVTDSEGFVLEESGFEEGREVQTQEKTEEVQDVVLEFETLEPGETVTETSPTEPPAVSGNVKEGEEDPEYDQTTVTETPREAEATLNGAEVTVGDGNVEVGENIEIGVESLQPSWPESGPEQDLNVWDETYISDGNPPEGYDYYYSGYTADSTYGAKVLDEEGKVLEYADVVQFTLTDPETGEVHTAYCADINTGTKTESAGNGEYSGWWYTMENVEDAEYYSDEAAEHIRAIAAKGYWGTAEGTGSLTQLKQTLKDALAAGEDLGLTAEQIEGMTAGEAQTATQMAIWMYGNHYQDQKVTFAASNCNGSWSPSKVETPSEEDLKAWEVINGVAGYLAGLKQSNEEDTQVLGPEKFISDVGLAVGEKVEDHENNRDGDDTNDAYHVDLLFALEVAVTENDDLVVKVIDANGQVIRTARLAGDDSVTGYGTIYPDGDGKYTIEELTLIEGENSFDLTLEGAQYLEQGVYIYTSEERDGETSQTFVGIAEGYQTVDLSLNVEFEFAVDEGKVETERVWRSTWEEEYTKPADPEETEPEETEPEETTEETVPRRDNGNSDIPKTGDLSGIWAGISLLSLSGLTVLGKKRKK